MENSEDSEKMYSSPNSYLKEIVTMTSLLADLDCFLDEGLRKEVQVTAQKIVKYIFGKTKNVDLLVKALKAFRTLATTKPSIAPYLKQFSHRLQCSALHPNECVRKNYNAYLCAVFSVKELDESDTKYLSET